MNDSSFFDDLECLFENLTYEDRAKLLQEEAYRNKIREQQKQEKYAAAEKENPPTMPLLYLGLAGVAFFGGLIALGIFWPLGLVVLGGSLFFLFRCLKATIKSTLIIIAQLFDLWR